MNMQQNPDEPIASYEINEPGTAKKPWILSLFPSHLRVESAEASHEIHRSELPELVQMFDKYGLIRQMMLAKLGNKSVFFQLTPEVFASVSEWIGPPTQEDLKFSLKRRFGWVFPIGVMLMLISMPIGDLLFEPISFSMGLALILTGLISKRWPHRILFAVDSVWFAFSASFLGWQLTVEWSWLRGIALLLQVALVFSGVREYFRFAPDRMAIEAEIDDDRDER